MLRELAPRPATARVLDVGPGSGVNLPLLRRLGRVTVVDVSPVSLERCRADGVRLVRAAGDRMPFADGSFDLVCALDVIEHLDDDRGALRECARVLAPDGRCLVTVPAFPLLWGRQDVLSDHRRRYRRAELAARLADAGLAAERLTYFNTLLFPPIAAVRLAMRPLLRWSVRGGSDLSAPTPFGLDRVLGGVFAAEAPWLVRRDLPFGVSLLALARRA